jgi:hypothetical protein
MHKAVITFVAGCLLASGLALAEDTGKNEVARDLGAVLAWRLGPEAVEAHCLSADPEGAEVRQKALKTWLDKNDALIELVDARIAEVVPLMYPSRSSIEAIAGIRAKVKAILLEDSFSGKTEEEAAAICRQERNPASPRWNNPGMPQVPASLAALYDGKIEHGGAR